MTPYVDTSGYNAAPGPAGDAYANAVTLHPNGLAAGTFNARGVALVPQGGESALNGPGALSVGPIYGMNHVGSFGGPFSPATNTYSLANFGTGNIHFTTVTAPVPWLTVTPSSGTITPGASITVAVTLNANANTQTPGLHAGGSLIFNPGAIGRPESLQVNAFAFSPTTNFNSKGPSGGPFTPSSTTYTLSNSTPGVLNWGVTNTFTWDSLSATNGSLNGLATTNITVSITNAVANSLAIGVYNDAVVFTDASHTQTVGQVAVNLQVGFGFFDDFSTFSDGNLVGQNNWYNPTPGSDDNAYQVASGVLVIPDGVHPGCPNAAEQEPAKNIAFTAVTDTTVNVYLGMSVTVTSAPPTPATWDFAMLPTAPGGNVAVNQNRTSVGDNGSGHYYWWARLNGLSGAPHSGSIARNYGTKYNVIIVGPINNSNSWVFVNPPSADTNDLFSMTPDARDGTDLGGTPTGASTRGVGSLDIDNFCSASAQAGFYIDKIAMSTNYADVYNFLAGVVTPSDPFTVWQSTYFSPGQLANPAIGGPNADPDQDGVSNTNEFLAGFNPTNAAAYPHIINIVRQGADMNVTYLGANGDNTWSPGFTSRTNVLEVSTGVPGSGNYSNNFASTGQTNILSGGNGLGQVTNMIDAGGATGATRYYRIRVIAP
jgi:hypothetical protein